MSLNQYIKNLRCEQQLSKREFAKVLGVSPATIVRIENETTLKPTKNLISKLATYLKKSDIEIIKDINYEVPPGQLTAQVYGIHLYADNWFIQSLYSHVNPSGEKFQFALKAIKKREPQNIMLIDQFDESQYHNANDYLAKAIYRIMLLQGLTPKQYAIVFSSEQKTIYNQFTKIHLNQIPFRIHLILVDTQKMIILKQYTIEK